VSLSRSSYGRSGLPWPKILPLLLDDILAIASEVDERWLIKWATWDARMMELMFWAGANRASQG
jgi:hypothetical protein